MSNELKITFVGGSDHLGDAKAVELEAPVLVGRSHKAGIRFTEKDRDVSGAHLEIRRETDGVFAVAIRAFVLNERDKVGVGEIRKLAKGDVLTLGPKSRAGIRIDALPKAGESNDSAEAPTGETRFTTATGVTRVSMTSATGLTDVASATGLTAFQGEATLPTQFAEPEAVSPDRTTGGNNFDAGETEIIDPEKLKALGSNPSEVPDDVDRPTEVMNASTTDGITSDSVTTGSGLDRTIALPQNAGATVIIDPKLLPHIDPDAPKRFRKRLMVFSIFGFAAMLGVVIYSRINHSDRYLSHPGFVVSQFKDSAGAPAMEVDYPWGSGSRKDETPTSLKVMTLTGKDRSCPFNLDFSIGTDSSQVGLSLEDAADREVEALTAKGYSFGASGEDQSVSPEERAGFFFYEDQYPLRCQVQLPRGTRFFRREYTVARNGRSWWGVYIFLRDGARVYRLFREIPESQKPRGKYLLLYNPNLSIYAKFLRGRWESAGRDSELESVGMDSLKRDTQKLLDRGWVEDWAKISRNINAMMVMTFGRQEADSQDVRTLLDDFRERKDRTWSDFELERDVAIRNGDYKKLKSIGARCRAAFGSDTKDWRFKRANDAKEWPWEIKAR